MLELEKKHPSVGRHALDRPLRHLRAGAQPQDLRADGALQRHLGRDGGARPLLPRAGPLHLRPLEHLLHQPAAHHHRGPARGGPRDRSTAASRSPTGRSRREKRSDLATSTIRASSERGHGDGNAWQRQLGTITPLDRRQGLGRAGRALGRRVSTRPRASSRRAWPSRPPRSWTPPWPRPRRPPSRWREASLASAHARPVRVPRSSLEKHKQEMAEILTREHGKVRGRRARAR